MFAYITGSVMVKYTACSMAVAQNFETITIFKKVEFESHFTAAEKVKTTVRVVPKMVPLCTES